MTRDEYRGGSYLTLTQTAILFAAVFALLTNGNVEAQEKLLKKEYINPVTSMGFTQVVTVERGGVKTIHVSGQVGRGEDMKSQASTAFAALKRQLEAAGATPADVVKLNTYVVGIDREAIAAYREAKSAVFDHDNQPASTLVGVAALVSPSFRIEIEAIAVVEAAGGKDNGQLTTEYINPDTLANFSQSFSQATAVKSGGVKTIHVSGQVAIGKDGQISGGDDIAAQADQAFKNVSLALEAAGATTGDVVKINVYIPNLSGEKTAAISRAMGKYFTGENRPASTWVGVVSLVNPRLMLEVEVTAVVED